jgi:hypothetical protein
VSNPTINVSLKSETPASGAEDQMHVSSPAENCAKIKHLGFAASKQIKMYGEQFEIVSDPFSGVDGCVSVQAISGTDPEIRTLRLPTTMLVGSENRFRNRPGPEQ